MITIGTFSSTRRPSCTVCTVKSEEALQPLFSKTERQSLKMPFYRTVTDTAQVHASACREGLEDRNTSCGVLRDDKKKKIHIKHIKTANKTAKQCLNKAT